MAQAQKFIVRQVSLGSISLGADKSEISRSVGAAPGFGQNVVDMNFGEVLQIQLSTRETAFTLLSCENGPYPREVFNAVGARPFSQRGFNILKASILLHGRWRILEALSAPPFHVLVSRRMKT